MGEEPAEYAKNFPLPILFFGSQHFSELGSHLLVVLALSSLAAQLTFFRGFRWWKNCEILT